MAQAPQHEATASARIFGTPGAALTHETGLSPKSVEAGLAGERETARILRRVAAYNGDAHIYHSLKLAGETADIDHAILVGATLILVDSKMWRGATTIGSLGYRRGEGHLIRLRHPDSSEAIEGLHTEFHTQRWADALELPRERVRGAVIFHSHLNTAIGGDYPFLLLNSREAGGKLGRLVRGLNPEELPPDPALHARLLQLLVAPARAARMPQRAPAAMPDLEAPFDPSLLPYGHPDRIGGAARPVPVGAATRGAAAPRLTPRPPAPRGRPPFALAALLWLLLCVPAITAAGMIGVIAAASGYGGAASGVSPTMVVGALVGVGVLAGSLLLSLRILLRSYRRRLRGWGIAVAALTVSTAYALIFALAAVVPALFAASR